MSKRYLILACLMVATTATVCCTAILWKTGPVELRLVVTVATGIISVVIIALAAARETKQ